MQMVNPPITEWKLIFLQVLSFFHLPYLRPPYMDSWRGDAARFRQDLIKSNKIDSPDSIRDLSSKGLKKKTQKKSFFLPSFSCYLICCFDWIQRGVRSTDL